MRRLNDKHQVGAGLFTDQGGAARPSVFPDARVDYYGATVGWKRKSWVSLRAKECATTMQFSTTIAARYALGVGESTAIGFDFTETGRTGRVTRTDADLVPVLYHEVSLYLGTALEF